MADVTLISLYDEFALGLRVLKTALANEGHDADLVLIGGMRYLEIPRGSKDDGGHHSFTANVTGHEFKLLRDSIAKSKPLLIGISSIQPLMVLAFRVIEEIRAVTDAPIIMGGIEATVNPEFALKAADLVCRGEGERLICDLTSRLKAGGDYHDLPNLAHRPNGSVVCNPMASLASDLDLLPVPDFSMRGVMSLQDDQLFTEDLPPKSYLRKHIMHMVSRGCPLACSFCCNSALRDIYDVKGNAGYHRWQTPSGAIEGLKASIAQQPNKPFILFQDDVFPPSTEWLREFAEKYRREIAVPFGCYFCPATSEIEHLKTLREMGCTYGMMGIQSASERTLKRDYRRPQNLDKAMELAWCSHDLGIRLIVDVITENPWETEEDYRQTLEFILRLPRQSLTISTTSLIFHEGYPITDKARKDGINLKPYTDGFSWYCAESTDERRFWKALLHLAQDETLSPETLRALADDKHLRENPAVLEQIEAMHRQHAFLPNSFIPKDHFIDSLQGELDSLRGSRAHMVAEKVRGWNSGVRAWMQRSD